MSSTTNPGFNAQRGVPFAPKNKSANGFKAFSEEKRKQEALAYDEHLTSQERLFRIKKRYNERKHGPR